MPALRLRTDASGLFWAAILDANEQLGEWQVPMPELPLRGALSEEQKRQSSTFRELLAVLRALQLLAPRLASQAVLLQSDSSGGVAALVKGRSASPLCWPLVRDISRLCLQFSIELLPTWVPREQNTLADSHTRVEADPGDWLLDSRAFALAQRTWPGLLEGPAAVDRFASMTVPSPLGRFNTRYYHPMAEAINCYTQRWEGTVSWMVPPFSQVGRALRHLEEAAARGVLVFPDWPSAPWWPLLLALRVGDSIPVPLAWVRAGEAGNPEPLRNPRWRLRMALVDGSRSRLSP
jgi:hypothetical protein